VKIWDFSSCSTGVCLSDSDEIGASSPCGIITPTAAGNSISTGANQKPSYVLHTPNAVGRIAWRPSSSNNTRAQRQQLQLATSSPDRGDISVWDVNMPNIPVCILKGHSNEACTGISWLDTPTGGPSSHSVTGPDKSKGVKGSFLQRAPPVQPQREERNWLGVHQHILSSGKDGRLLVQDLRNGTFPRQHIARAVATISSKGHVAFQRGEVSRVRAVLFKPNLFNRFWDHNLNKNFQLFQIQISQIETHLSCSDRLFSTTEIGYCCLFMNPTMSYQCHITRNIFRVLS
jgi:WD40 repeat protein